MCCCPGVTTLARLVTNVREETTQRLWKMLESLLTAGQRYVLDQLLEVPPGARVSDLERWRKGPPPRGSGPSVIKALDQVAEIMGLELAALRIEDLVPASDSYSYGQGQSSAGLSIEFGT